LDGGKVSSYVYVTVSI